MSTFFVEETIYRILPPLNDEQEYREVEYTIECNCWYTEGEGDNWNSPRIDPYVEIEEWEILKITRHDNGEKVEYHPGFIGPPEPDLVWFWDTLPLKDTEKDNIQSMAFDNANDMEPHDD